MGDTAVGKMMVEQELMKLTGLRLVHNHAAIELVIKIFSHDGEIPFERYIKIDNMFLSAKDTAKRIQEAFQP